MKHKVEAVAADKKGMTLAEVDTFIRELVGIQSTTLVRARVTFAGGIKSLSVEYDDGGERP